MTPSSTTNNTGMMMVPGTNSSNNATTTMTAMMNGGGGAKSGGGGDSTGQKGNKDKDSLKFLNNYLANDRTFLAWTRTSLSLVSEGVSE